jgi:hypothetical protein
MARHCLAVSEKTLWRAIRNGSDQNDCNAISLEGVSMAGVDARGVFRFLRFGTRV